MLASLYFHVTALAAVWTLVNFVGVIVAIAGYADTLADMRALRLAHSTTPVHDYAVREAMARSSIRFSVVRLLTLLVFAAIGVDSMFIRPATHQALASLTFAGMFIALACIVIYDTFASRRVRHKIMAYYIEEYSEQPKETTL